MIRSVSQVETEALLRRLEEADNAHVLAMQRVTAERDLAVRNTVDLRACAVAIEIERDTFRSQVETLLAELKQARADLDSLCSGLQPGVYRDRPC